MLESDSFARADPTRGRFRSFLMAAFTHFLAKQWRESSALKRGGGLSNLSLDEPEALHQSLAADGATPEQAYERAWGLALLDRAMERLRRKYEEAWRGDLYAALQPLLAGTKERPSYYRIGQGLGMSESAVTAAMHQKRKSYGSLPFAST